MPFPGLLGYIYHVVISCGILSFSGAYVRLFLRCCLKVTFANHAEGQWVLDWAQEAAEGDLRPEKGGPLVSEPGMRLP